MVVRKLGPFALNMMPVLPGFYPGKSASPPLHSHDFQEECFTVNAGRYCCCVLVIACVQQLPRFFIDPTSPKPRFLPDTTYTQTPVCLNYLFPQTALLGHLQPMPGN